MSEQLDIGVNCGHDASVCLLIDGRLAIALTEERITRDKHARGFPVEALRTCLAYVGMDESVSPSSVVLNQQPPACYEKEIEKLLPRIDSSRIRVNPSHHLLHACYAIAASGFDDAAILVVDGSGYSYAEHSRRGSPLLGERPAYDDMCEALSMYSLNKAGDLEVLAKQWGLWLEDSELCFRFPSLGHMYSMAAQLIFGDWVHAGKVMGLAPYGSPGHLPLDAITLLSDGITLSTDWINTVKHLDVKQGHGILNRQACDLAASVQSELERGMLHAVATLRELSPSRYLCITGGVGLNSVCNGLIADSGLYDRVFITPAAGDSGTAIGAAVFGYYTLLKHYPDLQSQQEFLGPKYSLNAIRKAIDDVPGIVVERISNPSRMAAEDVSRGRIVGWFEGRSEFGPRALGHRSILGDARDSGIKARLNGSVKFREEFRPYAASVLQEFCNDYFTLKSRSPHMLLVGQVTSTCRRAAPGIVHHDNSCRIQSVDTSYPGKFRDLLVAFESMTGVPLVVNTSMNIQGEPICETPQDAVRCLLHSGMEVLYLEEFRITKRSPWDGGGPEMNYIPILHDDMVLQAESVRFSGKWLQTNVRVLRDSYVYALTKEENRLLRFVDGARSIDEIVRGSGWDQQKVIALLRNLHNRGVVAFTLGTTNIPVKSCHADVGDI